MSFRFRWFGRFGADLGHRWMFEVLGTTDIFNMQRFLAASDHWGESFLHGFDGFRCRRVCEFRV